MAGRIKRKYAVNKTDETRGFMTENSDERARLGPERFPETKTIREKQTNYFPPFSPQRVVSTRPE